MKTVTIGGDRLGAGKKNRVELHGFERSTHDLGYVWRNTQAPGTLVPFMNILALPGDSFDINLGADVKTHPTLGPLFASFKLQLDVFQCPIRLYHKLLHNNKLGIGLRMNDVALPYVRFKANSPNFFPEKNEAGDDIPIDLQQVNPSCIFSYLGIRGFGHTPSGNSYVERTFNMTPYLAYWDIYKNYYANKQEEIGMVVHSNQEWRSHEMSEGALQFSLNQDGGVNYAGNGYNIKIVFLTGESVDLQVLTPKGKDLVSPVYINYIYNDGIYGQVIRTLEVHVLNFDGSNQSYDAYTATVEFPSVVDGEDYVYDNVIVIGMEATENPTLQDTRDSIKLLSFPLSNIDDMREELLDTNNFYYNPPEAQYPIGGGHKLPFTLPLEPAVGSKFYQHCCTFFAQEGLAIKTYQSDIFNNWMNTEFIDGDNGINAITAIDVSEGSFTIDTLNLSQKVYDMLNRIAISGGSYDDWVETVYDVENYRKAETPMYMGGLSKEIIFNEVVSTAESANGDPLATLAGKGAMSNKHKGGQVNISVNEPSYLIGIVSITPRIDYYQGNQFDALYRTMDDLHKPSLDEIGFQDLITDKMAAWDTINDDLSETFKSAGKQPAWLDYMTNYNRLHGNFADENNEMFMTLARRYEAEIEETEGNVNVNIKDLTTYIDPTKFNYAFAQTDLTAQNFWVQIGVDITARRKMSAKVMPNL